jgi:type VI protein secretion system component VasF
MRDEIADLVYPIVAYAVQTLNSVQRGDRVDMGGVQSELRGLLKTLAEAQRWPDFGGDGDRFLGIRYGLACWLDEIFLRDSPWNAQWNERKLEESLYGSNERAWKFWFQAKLAQMRPGSDALEAYHLLVMLGFRGEGPEKPETIAGWRDAVEMQLARVQNQPWSGPQELPPDLVVTPRRGRERLRTVLMLLIGLTALVVPFASFFLFLRFR